MKKIRSTVIIMASLGVFLTGCSMNFKKEEQVTQGSKKSTENKIIPKYSISDDYYKMVLPFKSESSKGIVNQLSTSKLNMNQFEMGLMRIAKDSFNTTDYFFQENQYLPKKTVERLVSNKLTDAQLADEEKKLNKKIDNIGLNPPVDSAQPAATQPYLSNILEHDYFIKDRSGKLTLGGVVVGLAMNSAYTKEELLAQGKEMAGQILKLLQKNEEVTTVPVIFSIFKQEPETSLIPGSFIYKTKLETGSQEIGQWTSMNEEYVVFPSQAFTDNHADDAKKIDALTTDVRSKFPDYISVTGKGLYTDNKLYNLTIHVAAPYNGKAEVISLTQVILQSIIDTFPKDISIEVSVGSEQNTEAIITREKDQDKPFVHFL
ncbi:CamS family sex pheromone protein [Microbacteriaceae bacterium 4G12]